MIYTLHSTYKTDGIGCLGEKGKVLADYVNDSALNDYVLLNTCNRAELYSTTDVGSDGFDKCKGTDAVRHLFSVACGLNSMVLGENEILGQVKGALRQALDEGHMGDELSRVFDSAIKLGSRVRARTKISHGKTSIASLAVDYALNQTKYPSDRVLVIGSGAMGSKIACALKNRGVNQIFLANRRIGRARELAGKVGGEVVDYGRLGEFLGKTSLVFTSTGAPHAIIRAGSIPLKEMLFVDLAVPADVTDEVAALGNVEVVRLEHFRQIAEKNAQEKSGEVGKVNAMIEESIKRLGVQ